MIHRFYVSNIRFVDGRLTLNELPVTKQLIQVLRVKIGKTLVLFDNSGKEYEVVVDRIHQKSLELKLLRQSSGIREPSIHITLYQAPLKKDKWEWLLQKVTELGVSVIVPLQTEHCISDIISDTKRERYEKILIEATEQCGGCRIPTLSEIQTLSQAFQSIQQKKSRAFLLHTAESENSLIQSVKGLKDISLLVGPEGGFSPKEIEQAKSVGIPIVSLGKRILRAETAGIIAVGLVLQNNE